MQENQSNKQLNNRPEKTEYAGKLFTYQQEGEPRKRYWQYERDKYTPYQNLLYKQTLFGLSVYSQQEIGEMAPQDINAIKKLHRRVQVTMNIWKQQITNKLCNHLFRTFFPKSPLSLDMRSKFTITDPRYQNTLSFKTLRISKDQIVDKLVKEKLLPENFHELKKKPKNIKSNGSTVPSQRRSLTLAES
jgi:hypothetical protein